MSRTNNAPKNRPSKLYQRLMNIVKVAWLQEPGSFGGHKPHKNGHRMVSGIIRAKLKKEYQHGGVPA